MELKDIYEMLKSRKLANEEFCKGERELGLFLEKVTDENPTLTEKFLELVPLEETIAYIVIHGVPAHDELRGMQYHLDKWIKAFEKELNINPQEEEFPEIIEMDT